MTDERGPLTYYSECKIINFANKRQHWFFTSSSWFSVSHTGIPTDEDDRLGSARAKTSTNHILSKIQTLTNSINRIHDAAESTQQYLKLVRLNLLQNFPLDINFEINFFKDATPDTGENRKFRQHSINVTTSKRLNKTLEDVKLKGFFDMSKTKCSNGLPLIFKALAKKRERVRRAANPKVSVCIKKSMVSATAFTYGLM